MSDNEKETISWSCIHQGIYIDDLQVGSKE
jgi:hypothetical protein